MAEILTRKGERILVDGEDLEPLNAYTWYVNSKGYAMRMEPTGLSKPRQCVVKMHRRIMGLVRGDGKHVDHINGDRLDNRRANLRICSHSENARNRKTNANSTSGFKGVHFHKRRRKWEARVQAGGKQKYLGIFDTPELAHAAYCKAVDMLHGEFSNHGETI